MKTGNAAGRLAGRSLAEAEERLQALEDLEPLLAQYRAAIDAADAERCNYHGAPKQAWDGRDALLQRKVDTLRSRISVALHGANVIKDAMGKKGRRARPSASLVMTSRFRDRPRRRAG